MSDDSQLTREDAQRIQALLSTGDQMSNVLFNLKQNEILHPSHRDGMSRLQQRWDRQEQEARNSLQKLSNLPALFDPIELGA